MPKKAPELAPSQVRRIKRPGLHAVGGVNGLCLNVTPTGAKSWIQRIIVGGRRRELGIGSYPTVTLEQARQRAREVREQVWRGEDPTAARKALHDAMRAAEAKRLTFAEAAKQCHRAKAHEFRSDRHAQNWINSLTMYANPVIGRMPVDQIEQPHIIGVLNRARCAKCHAEQKDDASECYKASCHGPVDPPIWTNKTETARRVRQRMEAVLAWATVSGHRNGDNPAAWKGNLEHVLGNPSKVRKVKHYAALPWQDMPDFMTNLRQREGMGARALEFAILTAARSGEVRLATWDEIDINAKLWTIPESRMKAGRAHKVPLSDPAVKLLKALPRFGESPYVFPAARGGVLSDMSISAVCRRMEVNAVPHGFRSTFKDWCRSSTSYPDEVSELALAHVSSDATRAAYARDELLPKRANLMRDWARFCGIVQTKGSVTPIRGAK
jgi:integrase